MTQPIFLPDEQQMGTLIENNWQDFCQQAKESGYDINDQTAEGWFKDFFVAGFAHGYNECLSIIRGQIEGAYIEKQILNNKPQQQ